MPVKGAVTPRPSISDFILYFSSLNIDTLERSLREEVAAKLEVTRMPSKDLWQRK